MLDVDRDGEWIVGRERSAEVTLDDAEVSRRHVLLRREGDLLTIEDLGSTNGTFLVEPSGAERRLEPGERVPVEEGSHVRIGRSAIVPCRRQGEDLLLTTHDPFDDTTTTIDSDGSPPAGERARAEALGALLHALETPSEDPWRGVLEGLVRLSRADTGFVFAPRGGRFVVRAVFGGAAPYCVSQRFLERTAERTRSWRLAPSAPPEDESLSPSLRSYSTRVELIGVPIRLSSGDLAAIGYLEVHRAVADAGRLATLDLFARAVGPWLAALDLADREGRRRRALEGRMAADPPRGSALLGDLEGGVVAVSSAFRHCVDTVRKVSASDATLLLRGPSGSGKEALALLAHEASPRCEHPFEALNCAALPAALVESELFGHDRGAFTGAEESKPGLFERADGGTVLLDEIGDLDAAAQAKILRVIETGEVTRLGGSRHDVDVRLIAATHRDLEEMVARGAFRADLYYRLRVIEVSIPPLAARAEDILPLARLFLARLTRARGTAAVEGLTSAAARALTSYDWPGNVRELRNVIERAVVLDRDGVIDTDDLPPDIAGRTGEESPEPAAIPADLAELAWEEARREFERRFFLAAYERCGRVGRRTARALGVSRRTVYEKLRRHARRPADE